MGAVELLLLPRLHKSADESSWGVKRERNVPVVESWEQSRATESQSHRVKQLRQSQVSAVWNVLPSKTLSSLIHWI